MAASPAVYHHRARVGALSRAVRNGERPQSDLDDARRDLVEIGLREHIAKTLAAAPPLGPERIARITALFRAGAPPGVAPPAATGGTTAPAPAVSFGGV